MTEKTAVIISGQEFFNMYMAVSFLKCQFENVHISFSYRLYKVLHIALIQGGGHKQDNIFLC